MSSSLLWYDLETFGRHPGWDRIAQFAAIRTNDRFEPMEDPIVLYCRISPDYLPDPYSCLITGITPKETSEKGLSEADFAKEIARVMNKPGTCVAGYNSIRFDDEFIRNLFYRNFYDPYQREYAQGNSRWDIIDLVRMTHDLRPDGIEWVYDEEGKPIFKLEVLSKANGLTHTHAHDALSDVEATIGLAKLIQEKQPKLFHYYFKLRKKEEVRRILNLQHPQPLVHASGMFTRSGGCSTIVSPLTVDPVNRNCIYSFDLRFDPTPLLELEVEEIRHRVFTPADQLGDTPRIPLKGIHMNKSPALAPLSTLLEDSRSKLGLNIELAQARHKQLHSFPNLAQKLRKVFQKEEGKEYQDPDLKIYSGGFFGDHDRDTFRTIRETSDQDIISLHPPFEDPRGPEMFRRYKGRNFLGSLTEEEKRKWYSYCATRLLTPEWDDAYDISTYSKKIDSLMQSRDIDGTQKKVLADLKAYGIWLERNILDYKD